MFQIDIHFFSKRLVFVIDWCKEDETTISENDKKETDIFTC